jgi:hypothetical protein
VKRRAHHLVDGFDEGVFVFLHSAANTKCVAAVGAYEHCSSDSSSFEAADRKFKAFYPSTAKLT